MDGLGQGPPVWRVVCVRQAPALQAVSEYGRRPARNSPPRPASSLLLDAPSSSGCDSGTPTLCFWSPPLFPHRYRGSDSEPFANLYFSRGFSSQFVKSPKKGCRDLDRVVFNSRSSWRKTGLGHVEVCQPRGGELSPLLYIFLWAFPRARVSLYRPCALSRSLIPGCVLCFAAMTDTAMLLATFSQRVCAGVQEPGCFSC